MFPHVAEDGQELLVLLLSPPEKGTLFVVWLWFGIFFRYFGVTFDISGHLLDRFPRSPPCRSLDQAFQVLPPLAKSLTWDEKVQEQNKVPTSVPRHLQGRTVHLCLEKPSPKTVPSDTVKDYQKLL